MKILLVASGIRRQLMLNFSFSIQHLTGQRPESRPQARNNLYAVFGSFCGNFAKKNGEGFLT